MNCCLLHTAIGASSLSCANTLAEATVQFEAQLIRRALEQAAGATESERLANAAKLLGLKSRQALNYIIDGRIARSGITLRVAQRNNQFTARRPKK